MTHVIGIDFESFGPLMANGFTQLGASLVRLKDGAVLAQFNEYASQEGYQPEDRCMREFWSNHPDVFRETCYRCALSSSSPHDVVTHFYTWLNTCAKDLECYIISDNVAFDVGILRMFSRDTDPMYAFGGQYRDIVDVSNWYEGASGMYMSLQTLDMSSKKIALAALNHKREERGMAHIGLPVYDKEHDHNASNDAEVMCRYWAFFQTEFEALKVVKHK